MLLQNCQFFLFNMTLIILHIVYAFQGSSSILCFLLIFGMLYNFTTGVTIWVITGHVAKPVENHCPKSFFYNVITIKTFTQRI